MKELDALTRPAAHFPLGVVVPTLNEEVRLPRLLDDLAALPFPCEIVVADGGSQDSTRSVAERPGVRIVSSPPGRGVQMNRGANALDTRWLLFLHADSRLSPEFGGAVSDWISRAVDGTPGGPHGPRGHEGENPAQGEDQRRDERAGYFGFRLDGDRVLWRLIELGQRLRERVTGLPYGDQGLLVSGRAFREVGGYEEVPLMEDVRMIRSLQERGRVERLPASLITSPRRYNREGTLRALLRNAGLMLLHGLRVPPRMLARAYRTEPIATKSTTRGPAAVEPIAKETAAREPTARRTLMVFAKAPVQGTVKTRLAVDIGEETATALYRRMGRDIVDRVRDGMHRTVILYDPPDALEAMREWLGSDGLEFRPQASGDLGARLGAAFDDSLKDGGAACVIGTDVPGLTQSLVDEAFAGLESGDVVLGPAEDGGYYLLGMKKPTPSLFREMAWSTDAVLAETRVRVRELGLQEVTLRTLLDVDTVADLHAVSHLLIDHRAR